MSKWICSVAAMICVLSIAGEVAASESNSNLAPLIVESADNKFELHILSATVSRASINVRYTLTNVGTRRVFVIAPDSGASLAGGLKVPFVGYRASDGVLDISSYLAPLPSDYLVETPYLHPVIRVYPGKNTRTLSLHVPTYANAPYDNGRPELVDIRKVRAIRLRLGYLPCEQVESVVQSIDTKPEVEYLSGGDVIECAGQSATLFKFQLYVEDIKTLRGPARIDF